MTAPMTATVIRLPSRETVELMPEAIPAASSGADLSAVAVMGATSIESPKANRSREGTPAYQKSFLVRTSSRRRREQPISAGPTVRRRRGPCRSASAPKREASTIMITLAGIPRSDVLEGGAQELQIELDVDELSIKGAVDEKRLQVGCCEVAPAEELEVQHRLRDPALHPHEGGERRHRDHTRPPYVGKSLVRALDESVGERSEPDCGEGCARKV